jgi:hypothetical protein
MAARERDVHDLNPGAALAAWLWPGAGHIVLGQRKRGMLIMFGVLFLVLCGLLVGGVSTVDRKDARLWFLAQSLNGPIVFALDYANQHGIKTLPDDKRNKAISIGHPAEIGTLFIALAGLMNLVVVLDALVFIPPAPEPALRRRSADHSPGGDAS